jgi:hypothetical protein
MTKEGLELLSKGIFPDEMDQCMIDVSKQCLKLQVDLALAVEVLGKIPDSQRMEWLAKQWYLCDKENRTAQHFYEGMLHMRSYILEALAKIRQGESK